MKNAIINKLQVEIFHEKIDNDFSFFQLTTTDKYISKGAYILDRPDLDLKTLSVAFDYGKSAFIIFKKDDVKSKKEILDSLGDEKLSIKELTSSNIKDYLLLRLFLYSLTNYSSKGLFFNNISGKLIVYSPEWISKNKKSFKALDIDIDRNLALLVSATTFTSVNLIKDKKLLKSSPQYLMDGKNYSLRRVLSSDLSDHIFIKTILGNRKTEIPFLNLSRNSISKSKSFYLYQTLELLNSKYSDYLKVSLETKPIVETINEIKERKIIDQVIGDMRFSIVNVVNLDKDPSDYSYFHDLVNSLMDIVSPNSIKVSNSIDPNTYNILMIHNSDYYEDNDYPDPYKLFDRSCVIQCVTKEDFTTKIDAGNKAAIKTCLKELVIKNDIINTKKITLDNWGDFAFSNEWTFGIESNDIQYFMVIKGDGSFNFFHKANDFTAFEDRRLNDLSNLISESDSKSKTIVSDNMGNTILISRTDMFTLPEKGIFTATGVRSKAGRENFLSGVVDINLYEDSDGLYYNVGPIGYGMNSSISKSSLIYKTQVLKGKNIIKDILKTMSVVFVKYNEFTVLPYPVKYLREYMNIIVNSKKSV